MFYYLEGTVAHIETNLAVVDVNGVGYACFTSLNSLASVKIGEKARFFTYTYIREDAFNIYGFVTVEELNCFKMLISISGVGPKAAMTVLSTVAPEQLALAIISEDENLLTSVPGIGKKSAQRIILELGDKMRKERGITAAGQPGASVGFGSILSEAESALAVLGYGRSEIASAMKGIKTDGARVEDIIKAALKNLTRL